MTSTIAPLRWRGGSLPPRPAVMAILNATPDSFFDGGRHEGHERALRRAWAVVDDGADVLDLGGESTRPGAAAVPLDEELRRVVPVVEALVRDGYPLPISLDTSRAEVARLGLAAGAIIVNDVTGGTREPSLLHHVAEAGAAVVLMHTRGTPETMQSLTDYDDVVEDVLSALAERCEAATAAGIPPEHQSVDPGIGFAKTSEDCVRLIANTARLRSLGRPVLVGASRKSFLGRAFGQEGEERLFGSLAVAAFAAMAGGAILRVHDVRETRAVLDVVAGLAAAAPSHG